MPRQTFLNLPEEKRLNIINISLKEFANNSYDKASLSQIVHNAGIAKGSMYQYFADKQELYTYLVHFTSERKLSYVSAALPSGQDDFFQLYKDIIFTAARFDLEYPLYSSFLYSVGKDTHNRALSKEIMQSSVTFMKSLLSDARAKGQIREGVNLDLASFLISYLSVDVGEYISEKYGYSYLSVLMSESGELPVTDSQLGAVLDELIDFFRLGIAAV